MKRYYTEPFINQLGGLTSVFTLNYTVGEKCHISMGNIMFTDTYVDSAIQF